MKLSVQSLTRFSRISILLSKIKGHAKLDLQYNSVFNYFYCFAQFSILILIDLCKNFKPHVSKLLTSAEFFFNREFNGNVQIKVINQRIKHLILNTHPTIFCFAFEIIPTEFYQDEMMVFNSFIKMIQFSLHNFYNDNQYLSVLLLLCSIDNSHTFISICPEQTTVLLNDPLLYERMLLLCSYYPT
jgi:hypothetical protein